MDRRGRPQIQHVLRVALAVHRSARPLALVHDICERTQYTPRHVGLELGLDRESVWALQLVSKAPGENVLEHARRIAAAEPGPGQELAAAVMRADLADHRRHAARGAVAFYDAAARLLGAEIS